MKVFIFGNKGNMGRRYASILRYLGHEALGCDLGDNARNSMAYQQSDYIIVATPTNDHLSLLKFLAHEGKNVLCEKPITKDFDKLIDFISLAENQKMHLSMVSQYDYMIPNPMDHTYDNLLTSYDYFQTGKDGIAWDCINIIWHARSKIKLKNTSPTWRCVINGYPLNRGMVDFSYVEMIENWLSKPYEPQYDRILKSHKKVLDFIDGKFD